MRRQRSHIVIPCSMHSHSESPQPFAPPPQERYDLNARRSRAANTVSDPHAEARTRRHSLNSRVSLPPAGALGGIVVTVILAGHEGTHPVFKTTITKTNTANRRGNTTVLNKRFGEFRHLYEKVCYLNLHESSICFKVFRFILASRSCSHLINAILLAHAGAKYIQAQAPVREPHPI